MASIDQICEGDHPGVTVIGSPKSNKLSRIEVKGRRNLVELRGEPIVDHLKIEILGDDNKLVIGPRSRIRGVMTVGEGSLMQFGADINMTRNSRFVAREGTRIIVGDKCLISNVTVMSTDAHSIFDATTGERLNIAADVIIGDAVWLAEHVAIYKGSRIGSGSVVGARSIVRGDIPPRVVAAGTPARVIRENILWDPGLLPHGRHLLGREPAH